MNKPLKYIIIAFIIFFIFSIVFYSVVEIKNNAENEKNNIVEVDKGVFVDIDKAISQGKWYDITEEDKITLALAAETSVISDVKQYLKDNKIAIFFVYGGPFDYSLQGNYIICTGFNEDGRAKILYPDDGFTKEWKYSFEGLIEFATKVMMFEM